MLQSCARLLRVGSTLCHQNSLKQISIFMPRCFSVSHPYFTGTMRDFGFPNDTWSQNMVNLYNRFLELSKDGSWKQIPSFNTTVHHMEGPSIPCLGDIVEPRQEKRLFTRNLDKDGVGFEYTMFYNIAKKRMVTLFQPGPYLEGPPGFTHGGCIATIIDSTAGACVVCTYGSVMTANLNVNYRNPIPLGSTVIVDSQVDKVEGRKVYASCQIRSHDDALLHTEATALFIKLNP